MASLFYVIGASGVGKDSIMKSARACINGSQRIVFAHRYITRLPNHDAENHIHLSVEEFEQRKQAGFFCFFWNSHGYSYGIGTEVHEWLSLGFNVVINGSREYLPKAQLIFPSLKVILIESSSEIIQQRLRSRGRETNAEIEKRMARNFNFTELNAMIKINNDGQLDTAVKEMIDIIQ
ncbi:MAG: phosphonate metabolism protein/1,5-bisphosphokinase (PRPP-forming) PhnN [Chitinophagaceae bacterium]|nr:phosphonate metabolism protein/1,5-bisphosphokinase (PRPP-forming) PhnN [Chitinophagaceae bacterium]